MKATFKVSLRFVKVSEEWVMRIVLGRYRGPIACVCVYT